MSPEWVSIRALRALFVVGTVLPINMGALGLVGIGGIVVLVSPLRVWAAIVLPSGFGEALR
jgi:hypothetical protein